MSEDEPATTEAKGNKTERAGALWKSQPSGAEKHGLQAGASAGEPANSESPATSRADVINSITYQEINDFLKEKMHVEFKNGTHEIKFFGRRYILETNVQQAVENAMRELRAELHPAENAYIVLDMKGVVELIDARWPTSVAKPPSASKPDGLKDAKKDEERIEQKKRMDELGEKFRKSNPCKSPED